VVSGLRRIGIDEISHRRGQRYLPVVVCHDSGRLVWAAAGRDRKTVEAFFDQLGEERCKQVELVSCDMAGWISGPVAQRLPDAVRYVDPFHVVMLATDALDEIRREVWNDARRAGEIAAAKDLKGARYALWKNPENLTDRQTRKLASIQKDQPSALPRLPAQGATQTDLPPARRAGNPDARRLDRVGPAMSPSALRQARQNDHQAARRDRRRDQPRPVQRPRRSDQHPDPTDHPTRLWLPQPRRPDRPGDALAGQPLPAPPTTTQPLTRPTETSGAP
jgi:hypothetical protein